MKALLISLVAVTLVGGLVGGGLFAYFSDTETSTGNTFNAGILDLQLNDGDPDAWADGADVTWSSAPDWKPGQSVTGVLEMRDGGTGDIGWIGIKPVNVQVPTGPADYADKIIITNFSMQENGGGNQSIGNIASLMANWGIWGPADGELTLADFASGNFYFYTEPTDWVLQPGVNTVSLTMTFEFDSEAGNPYQGAVCTFDLRVVAVQNNYAGPPNFTHIGDAGCGYGTVD